MRLIRRPLTLSLAALLSLLAPTLWAQDKPITLDDIFVQGRFRQQLGGSLAFTADDRHVTELVEAGGGQALIKRPVEQPEQADTLIRPRELSGLDVDQYVMSTDERRVLLITNSSPIYRHSFTAVCYVFDLVTRTRQVAFEGRPVQNAALSPDASRLAFVYQNNLYVQELPSSSAAPSATVQVTTTGEKNKIIHGATDWVYEEEFGFAEGFYWSPDGARIAYYSFDESAVPVFGMDMYGGLYPKRVEFKYPKAGEKNAVVKLTVYELGSGKHVAVDVGPEPDQYLPRVRWTSDPFRLAFLRLNRLQNRLELLTAEAQTGVSRVVLTEQSDTYLEVEDHTMHFLPGGAELLWLSDRSGWLQYYRYDLTGRLLGQVTSGEADVAGLLGVDAKAKTLYYAAADPDPREVHVYAVGLNGKGKRRVTEAGLHHSATFSPQCTYWLDRASAPMVPTTVTLRKASGKTPGAVVRVMEDNAKLRQALSEFAMAVPHFFEFTNATGTKLHGWLLRPAQFDSAKKHPVLLFTYGGPHSQNVTRSFGATANAWFHHLVGQGYLVACVDNRGTDARGRDFKKVHYKQLGIVEAEDLVAAAQHLGAQRYVDRQRIGVYGHSYGGYMTLMALAKGPDVFKMGISAAPVTSWRYYDTIYTERYMSTPQLNAEGYDRTAPITLVGQIKAPLLLLHGTADDNVHFQNSLDLVEALAKANVAVDMAFYPNRNHGIGGGRVPLHRFTKMTRFVLEKL